MAAKRSWGKALWRIACVRSNKNLLLIWKKTMGGLGSGRVSAQHREKVEQARFIPSSWVRERMGVLGIGAPIIIGWKQGSQPFGEAGMVLFDQRLHIVYRKRSDGEAQWQDVHEVVELSYTEPHFGGKRLWFLCPHCGRRVAVLYCSDVVACRKCQHLSYRTEREDAIDRLRSKAAKIKDRLGGDPYQRPKWMHRKTFARLREQYFMVSLDVERRAQERLITVGRRIMRQSASRGREGVGW